MPKRLNLTDLAVKRFPLPEKGTSTFWDTTVKGLGVRVSQGGARTFIVLIGSGKRKKIGRYPTISLAKARTEAKHILAEQTLGGPGVPSKSISAAQKEFLSACEAKNRPSTVRDYRTRLTRHFKPNKRMLGDLSRADVMGCVSKLKSTPSEQRHAFVAIKVFLNWCVSQGYLEHNPVAGAKLDGPPPTSKERILTPDELAAVWKTAGKIGYPFGHIVRLLILTGQRRGETAALQWQWIAYGVVTLPANITKNKREHRFPIGTLAQDIIADIPVLDDCPYLFPATRRVSEKTTVFNGWGKPKAELDKLSKVSNWTLHDLRRTFSSTMASLGVQQVVVEKLLNHVSGGTQSPIAATYNRYSYMDEMREAMTLYEDNLRSHLSKE